MPEPPLVAHVVSHTHWDREWYRTFEVFRIRLVDHTDALLELLERDPDYGPYYWDGQTCVIDDYLEIRPENADRLRRAFASGRLVTGPWFAQPDEFLVSGEAMVRNLLLGQRTCRQWHTGQQVGYAPDAFGHTSQMPQILRGFGIDNAVFFRGITTDQVASEFRWRAPDGSEVLAIKMPDDTAYSNFYYRFRQTLADTDRDVPIAPERVEAEATRLLEESLAARPTTRHLLWMDGVDHILPQPRTPEILRIVNQRLGHRVRAHTATLRQYIDQVLAAAPDLATVTGELRVSNRAWGLQALLAHVASSRIHLKQLNHRCEVLLERWAEPWTTFAWLLERQCGPLSSGERRPEFWQRPPTGLLRHAWRQLLLNQPHDSICGCSVDQVHRDMLDRYERCLQVGEQLTAEALARVARRIDTSGEGMAAVVVFNPLGWERQGELVELTVCLPAGTPVAGLGLAGPEGEVQAEFRPLAAAHTLTQAPHDIPVGQAWQRFAVRFLAGAPGFGWSAYRVLPRPAGPTQGSPAGVWIGAQSLANQHLEVVAQPDGRIDVTDRATGRTWPGGLVFEDGGDFGDGYNYVRPAADRVFTTADPGAAGPVSIAAEQDATEGRLVIRRTWRVPEGRDGDGREPDLSGTLDLTATVRLKPAATRVELAIEVVNNARDHRLRVLFPSGARQAREYQVEQAYDVVSRSIARPDCTGWREPQPATGPQKSFVDVADGSSGLCVINRGLPECEVVDDLERTIAVTLLRATGNGVGAPDGQAAGQLPGCHRFELALYPHAGSWLEAGVWQQAHAVTVPLRAVQIDGHAGPLPGHGSFLSVGPETVVPCAVKASEEEDAWILRAVNYGPAPAAARFSGRLLSGAGAERIELSDLAESPGQELVTVGGSVPVPMRSRQIATLRVQPGPTA